MRKLLILLVVVIFATSCESVEDRDSLKVQIRNLESIRHELGRDIRNLQIQVGDFEEKLVKLRTEEHVLSGGKMRYVVYLKLKQSHFSLNLMKHAKDAMNAVVFPMEVSKDFYDRVHVGESILEEFRGGSLLTEASIGSWEITVKSKKAEVIK